MTDSWKELQGLTKRQLLARLAELIHAWDGQDALGRERERQAKFLLDALFRCPLYLAESHWLDIFEIWLLQAVRKPGPMLRQRWLAAVDEWQAYSSNVARDGDAVPEN